MTYVMINEKTKNARRPNLTYECSVVEERLRFVARLLDGEAMTDVCSEFRISRNAGYKIFDPTRSTGSRPSTIARAGPCAMPTSCRNRSNPSS
jgi:hypothetical protein